MAYLFKPVTLLMLLAGQYVGALEPSDAPPKSTHHITASYVTTIAVSAGTLSHTCYTKNIATPYYGEGCPNLATCGGQADCIGIKTATVTVPAKDPLCPQTATKVVDGPCETCHKGCRWTTSTLWLTEGEPLPTAAPAVAARSDASKSCATTIFKSSSGGRGPTTTYHPITQTRISLVNCSGCDLVVTDLNGLGPGISHSVTVTDTKPFIVTDYACQ